MSKETLPLSPTTNHTYGHTGHRVFMYQEAKDWQESVVWKLKKYKGENPTEVSITYYLARERDVEGSHKLFFDAMTKAQVVVDDKFILDVHLHKRFDKHDPRMEVEW